MCVYLSLTGSASGSTVGSLRVGEFAASGQDLTAVRGGSEAHPSFVRPRLPHDEPDRPPVVTPRTPPASTPPTATTTGGPPAPRTGMPGATPSRTSTPSPGRRSCTTRSSRSTGARNATPVSRDQRRACRRSPCRSAHETTATVSRSAAKRAAGQVRTNGPPRYPTAVVPARPGDERDAAEHAGPRARQRTRRELRGRGTRGSRRTTGGIRPRSAGRSGSPARRRRASTSPSAGREARSGACTCSGRRSGGVAEVEAGHAALVADVEPAAHSVGGVQQGRPSRTRVRPSSLVAVGADAGQRQDAGVVEQDQFAVGREDARMADPVGGPAHFARRQLQAFESPAQGAVGVGLEVVQVEAVEEPVDEDAGANVVGQFAACCQSRPRAPACRGGSTAPLAERRADDEAGPGAERPGGMLVVVRRHLLAPARLSGLQIDGDHGVAQERDDPAPAPDGRPAGRTSSCPGRRPIARRCVRPSASRATRLAPGPPTGRITLPSSTSGVQA